MKRLWAPWRMEYITGPEEEGCIFCNAVEAQNDEKNLVIYRGKLSFVLMNKYPYNNGHLMIAPYKHTGSIPELKDEEFLDMLKLLKKSIVILDKYGSPHGYNIGMNIGRVAGAGIVDHVHIHIVPRWKGDTNFMPVISETKVISEHIELTYKRLKELWGKTENFS